MDPTRIAPSATALGDLSDFGRSEGRVGGQCSYGRPGDDLRNRQQARHLVSDKPFAAGFFPARNTTAQIAAFHWDSFIIAVAVHLVTSLIVGLLYGAMLPVFPRRPIL